MKYYTLLAVQTANFFPLGDHVIDDTFCIPSIAGNKFAEYYSYILI